MNLSEKPTDKSATAGLILYSRCLEHGKWPDQIEFTKYLFLLDCGSVQMGAGRATDIRWKFYHYGPWSEDLVPVMNYVQEVFRLGWVDYASAEDRELPQFDRITEKLSLVLESLINRILNAFAHRDASFVVDYCYRFTEPMRDARRGEPLDLSTVPVTGVPPVFVRQPKTIPMPQLTTDQMTACGELRRRIAGTRARYEEWKALMEQPVYQQAMGVLALEQEISADAPPKGINVKITDGALAELDTARHE